MLPRPCLEASLRNIGAPPDLVSLVLFIHDNAVLVLEKCEQRAELGMARGIRQGCGLSPLLWLCFTVLLHGIRVEYIPPSDMSGFADDYLVKWNFESPRDFLNAQKQVAKIIQALENLGMQVSVDKTVILLAIKGAQAAALLKEATARKKGGRFLKVHLGSSTVMLPIKQSHTYLGAKISYYAFERVTMQHRLEQSWIAFHRLHAFLKSQQIPLQKRVALWRSCVWSVTQYSLTAAGLDEHSRQQLVSQTLRQLRIVARSPAHVTRETNESLLKRLNLEHPLVLLHKACCARIQTCASAVGHLQPPEVKQWWHLLPGTFHT